MATLRAALYTIPNFNSAKLLGKKLTNNNDTQTEYVALFSELAISGNPPQGEDLLYELKEALNPM